MKQVSSFFIGVLTQLQCLCTIWLPSK